MEMNLHVLEIPSFIVQLVFSGFFIAGFVTYYQRIGERAFADSERTDAQRIRSRVYMMLLSIVIGIIMHLGGYHFTIGGMMYHNVGLFVLAFPLLDSEISLWEFAVRAFAIIAIWVIHHLDALTTSPTIGSFIVLAGVLYVARRYHGQIRYNLRNNFLFAAVIACAFWFTLPNESGGIQINMAVSLQAVMMFLIMDTFTSFYWVAQHHEATENARMRELANYDQLTNAKTYAMYQHDLTTMFNDAKQNQTPLTLVSLDVDHFKQVNEHYGHLAGNAILINIATTLTNVLQQYGDDHRVYRTGGEEFNIAFPNKQPDEILPIVTECWETVRKTRYKYEDYDVLMTLSMGVTAVHPADRTIDDTYKRADDNLYISKRAGRDTITVEGRTVHTRSEQELVATYTFFTQGIMDIRTQNNERYRNELLLRMYDHNRDRWSLPETFDISVETQIHLIERVLQNSRTKRVAMNLTLAQFVDPTIATALTNFRNSPGGPEGLTVEITDVPDIATMRNITPIYRAGGVRIDIDDVGSDNSYELVRGLLPYVDGVKFAMQNLRKTNDDQQLRERVDFWVLIAKENELDFVLEGVENEDEVTFAMKEGIPFVQGYYFSKPELPSM